VSEICFGEGHMETENTYYCHMSVVDSDGNNFSVYEDMTVSICGEFLAYDWCAIFELSKELWENRQ